MSEAQKTRFDEFLAVNIREILHNPDNTEKVAKILSENGQYQKITSLMFRELERKIERNYAENIGWQAKEKRRIILERGLKMIALSLPFGPAVGFTSFAIINPMGLHIIDSVACVAVGGFISGIILGTIEGGFKRFASDVKSMNTRLGRAKQKIAYIKYDLSNDEDLKRIRAGKNSKDQPLTESVFKITKESFQQMARSG
ncbi:MAG: hypothetical protein KGH52_04240 [Candidatus Micrarchaeota archaeon]|nr:hypothetical protein [Candidatus Micrarchaeota archaeon]